MASKKIGKPKPNLVQRTLIKAVGGGANAKKTGVFRGRARARKK